MTKENKDLTIFLIRRNPVRWTRVRRSVVPCGSLSPHCFTLLPTIWMGHEEIRKQITEKFKEDYPEVLMEFFMLGGEDDF